MEMMGYTIIRSGAMGIDIGFVKLNADGELEPDGTDIERVTNAPGFFNMMQMVSHLMPMFEMLEKNDPNIRPHLQGFRDYVLTDRADRLAKFRDYSEFLQRALGQMHEMAGGGEMLAGGLPAIDVDEFDEDLRAFIGGFMLSDKSFGADEVAPFVPFLGVTVGLLKHGTEAYAESQPQVAEAMHAAAECVATLAKFCDDAVTQNKRVYVSC